GRGQGNPGESLSRARPIRQGAGSNWPRCGACTEEPKSCGALLGGHRFCPGSRRSRQTRGRQGKPESDSRGDQKVWLCPYSARRAPCPRSNRNEIRPDCRWPGAPRSFGEGCKGEGLRPDCTQGGCGQETVTNSPSVRWLQQKSRRRLRR